MLNISTIICSYNIVYVAIKHIIEFTDKPRNVFSPNDTCYECGEKGHYAYDCPRRGRGTKTSRYQRYFIIYYNHL